MDQHFRRHDGEPFDPFYYRGGEPAGAGWYRLENAWFFETGAGPYDDITFAWENRSWTISAPADDEADVTYVTVEGVESPPDELVVVVVRRRSALARVRSLLRRETSSVSEQTATARPA